MIVVRQNTELDSSMIKNSIANDSPTECNFMQPRDGECRNALRDSDACARRNKRLRARSRASFEFPSLAKGKVDIPRMAKGVQPCHSVATCLFSVLEHVHRALRITVSSH